MKPTLSIFTTCCVLLLSGVTSVADETDAGSSDQTALESTEPNQADVPEYHEESVPADPESMSEELDDPAFDQYVDISLFGRAINQSDAALMADVGLQLREGERVLKRPHKLVTSQRAIDMALDLATGNGDSDTLDRLGRVAEATGDSDLGKRVKTAVRLSGTSRSVAADVTHALEAADAGPLGLYQELLASVGRSELLDDSGELKSIEKDVKSLDSFPDPLMKHILDRIREAQEAVSEQPKPDVDQLRKLAGNSRAIGGYLGQVGNKVANYAKDRYIPIPEDSPSTISPVPSSPGPRQFEAIYKIRNNSNTVVRVKMWPSGRRYEFLPGREYDWFRSRSVGRPPQIHVYNSGRTYDLVSGRFHFWSRNGYIKFSKR